MVVISRRNVKKWARDFFISLILIFFTFGLVACERQLSEEFSTPTISAPILTPPQISPTPSTVLVFTPELGVTPSPFFTIDATTQSIDPQPTTTIPIELTPTPVEVAAAGVNTGQTEEGLFTTEVVGAIGSGTFDFMAPRTIVNDESSIAKLSMRLDREFVDPEAVRIIVTTSQIYQDTNVFTQQHLVTEKITLFQNMSARLTGTENLRIDPETITPKPIFPGNDAEWIWFITPSSETGSQELIRLEIFANPNDRPFTLYTNIFPIQIEQKVVPSKSLLERIVDNLVDNTTSVFIGISGLMTLILLGGLISLTIFNNRKSDTTTPHHLGTSKLRPFFRLINTSFNEPEIINICFGLGIRYSDLPGETQSNKVWQLLAYCQRNDCISELLALCKEARPQVNWGQVS